MNHSRAPPVEKRKQWWELRRDHTTVMMAKGPSLQSGGMLSRGEKILEIADARETYNRRSHPPVATRPQGRSRARSRSQLKIENARGETLYRKMPVNFLLYDQDAIPQRIIDVTALRFFTHLCVLKVITLALCTRPELRRWFPLFLDRRFSLLAGAPTQPGWGYLGWD